MWAYCEKCGKYLDFDIAGSGVFRICRMHRNMAGRWTSNVALWWVSSSSALARANKLPSPPIKSWWRANSALPSGYLGALRSGSDAQVSYGEHHDTGLERFPLVLANREELMQKGCKFKLDRSESNGSKSRD